MSLTKATYSMINGAPANVLDYGADATGVADSTAAFAAALAAADAVYVPTGTYKTTSPLAIAANKKIFGDGLSSIISFVGTTDQSALYCGNSAALSYGIIIQDLEIQPVTAATNGIYLLCTVGASVVNVRVSSPTLANGNSGFIIDGGDQSSFFNIFQNCYALHCSNYGFRTYTTGSSYATINYFIDCSVIGDALGVGFEFALSSGVNSIMIGGNAENCAVGLNLVSSTGITVNGLRFEANTTDLSTTAYTTECNFIGVQNIATISGLSWQNGYGKNTFIGCSGANGVVNRQEATNIIYSKGIAETPVTIQGYPSQTAALQQWKNSSGTVLAAIEDGAIRVNSGAKTVGANEISIGSLTATTVGAAGGASALPATPVGYLIMNIGGTDRKIPYYTA